eukprot:14741313-Heterocapsa_arctica.AAC.1
MASWRRRLLGGARRAAMRVMFRHIATVDQLDLDQTQFDTVIQKMRRRVIITQKHSQSQQFNTASY